MTKEEELLDAAYDDDVAKAASLLAAGVAVDSENEDGVTALYEAVRKKSYATAELLLQKGADTAKQYNQKKYTVLHMAVSDDDQKMTALLAQHMNDINIRDKFGNTALWTAIHQASLASNMGNNAIVELLLQKGADPYTPNRMGEMVVGKSKTPVGESLSPYDSAVRSKLTEVLALIEKYAPKPA
jgi:ankyrin repeat protein